MEERALVQQQLSESQLQHASQTQDSPGQVQSTDESFQFDETNDASRIDGMSEGGVSTARSLSQQGLSRVMEKESEAWQAQKTQYLAKAIPTAVRNLISHQISTFPI